MIILKKRKLLTNAKYRFQLMKQPPKKVILRREFLDLTYPLFYNIKFNIPQGVNTFELC